MSQMQMWPVALPVIIMGAFSMLEKKEIAVTAEDWRNCITVYD